MSFSGLNNASDLGRLDPATGVLTRLGPTGFRTLFGVQFDAAFRTLYAITGAQMPPVLVSLDPTTGQGTAIARTDLPTQADVAGISGGRPPGRWRRRRQPLRARSGHRRLDG